MTYSDVLKRALLAGSVMAVVMGAYMLTVVEPVVDRAIALEQRLDAADPDTHASGHDDAPLYTRGEQKAGGVGAAGLYALAIGLVFGTVFAWRRHVLPGASDFARAVWLAAVGFAVFGLVPALKYPANPPGVGDPDTVTERTLQYIVLIVISLVLTIALARLSRTLRARLDDASRIAAVATAAIVAFGLTLVLTPATPDAIDPAIPAGLVWDLRLRSVGGLALMWIGFGLVFAWLLSRASTGDVRATSTARPVVA